MTYIGGCVAMGEHLVLVAPCVYVSPNWTTKILFALNIK